MIQGQVTDPVQSLYCCSAIITAVVKQFQSWPFPVSSISYKAKKLAFSNALNRLPFTTHNKSSVTIPASGFPNRIRLPSECGQPICDPCSIVPHNLILHSRQSCSPLLTTLSSFTNLIDWPACAYSNQYSRLFCSNRPILIPHRSPSSLLQIV